MSDSTPNAGLEEDDKGLQFPGLFEALVLAPQALLRVLRAPFVLLTVFVCMTLPAFLLLSDYYKDLNSVLAGNPLANGVNGLILQQDFDRLYPDGHELPGLMQIVWALMITFFAGGLLSTVGLGRKPRPGLSGFLAESGRWCFRSFRTLVPSLLLLMLWTWVFTAFLKPWILGLDLAQVTDTRAFWVGFGLNILYLFGMGKILILRRLALARLVHTGRHSAFRAWMWTLAYWMRHPFVTLTAYLPLFVLFAGGAIGTVYGLDALLVHYNDMESRPIYFMLAAQVFPLFYLALNLSSFLLARQLVAIDTAIREGAPPPPQVFGRAAPGMSEPVAFPATGQPATTPSTPAESASSTPVKEKAKGTAAGTVEEPEEEKVAWEWTPEESPKRDD